MNSGRQRHRADNMRFTLLHLKNTHWSSCRGSAEMNLTSIYEDEGSTPGLAQWVKDQSLLQAVPRSKLWLE